MLEKNEQTTHQEKQTELASFPPSSFRWMRNALLSFLIPVDFGIKLDEMLNGLYTEKREFKLFIQEIDEGLIIEVGTTNFIGKLMPLYIMETLRQNLRTGSLLDLGERNEFDLSRAYSPEVDEATQQLYKQRVFKRFMSNLGPHGLKFIQNLQTKDPNGWIAEVVRTTQSALPAPSIEEFEQQFRDAFKAQGSIYGERFSEFFTVKKIIGAGTIGSAAEVEFRSEEGFTEECVIKIPHKDIADAFRKDYECLDNAAKILLETKQISTITAEAFAWYNKKWYEVEMLELDFAREMGFLYERPYDEPEISMTVKAIPQIAKEAKGIVSMKKANGIELGTYLQDLNRKLTTANTKEERDSYLDEITQLRTLYSKFALFHFKRVLNNESIHSDLHPGNLFYDRESKLLYVLDLGSMMHPINSDEHLKVQRFFFALHLSIGSADSHYLRLYYREQQTVSMDEIEPMLTNLQNTFDAIKKKNAGEKVINADLAIAQAMGVIKDSILTIGGHIVPSALFITIKANSPVNDTLNALRNILTSSSHEHAIPRSESTLLAISLKASYQAGSMRKTLWTKELWDYFLHNLIHPKGGLSQLHYEKQFIYGIFSLKDEEAALADLLIPATMISATLAVFLIAFGLKKLANSLAVRIPELINSPWNIQEFAWNKNMGMPRMTRYIKPSNIHTPLFNWPPRMPVSTLFPARPWCPNTRIPTALPYSKPVITSKTSLVERFVPKPKGYGRFGFFAAGITAAGTVAFGAYNQWKQGGETPSCSNDTSGENTYRPL